MSRKHVTSRDEGLLIVGHGTRDENGQQEFLAVAQSVARRTDKDRVFAGFLELARPTVAEAIDDAAAHGVRRLRVMPLMLLAAGHAKQDIPRAVEAAASRHPGLSTRMVEHLGCHPSIVELSARRFRQSLLGRDVDPASAEYLFLVMVGRGSSDQAAAAEMRRFTGLRRELTPVNRVETCFAALAAPSLEQMLGVAVRSPMLRVVVQPHLLFSGALLSRIETTAHEFGRQNARQTWFVTGPLGPDELLVDAICQICRIG